MKNEINYKLLGENIRDLRSKKGFTQQELAEKVFCNTSHISNIENNYTKVSLNSLLAIANTLDTTIDSLLQNQYINSDIVIENEIFSEISKLDNEKKELLLRIIKVL